MSIGDRIRQIRGSQSQASFAESLGIAQRTLAHYEKNNRTPNTEFAVSLAQKYNVSFDWLLTGVETAQSDSEARELDQPAQADCPNCKVLTDELRREREEVRELSRENRTLWKENGTLKEEIGKLRGENRVLENKVNTFCETLDEDKSKTA